MYHLILKEKTLLLGPKSMYSYPNATSITTRAMKRKSYVRIFAILLSVIVLASCERPVSRPTNDQAYSCVDSLLTQANSYLFTEPLRSCRILREALPACTDEKDQVQLQNLLAKALFLSSQYDSALYYSEKVIDYCWKQKELTPQIHRLLTENYNILGNTKGRTSGNNLALHYYKQALFHCLQSDKQRFLPDLCTNIADTYVRTGDFVNGVMYYRQALHYADSLGLPQEECSFIYHGLGHTYTELHDFDNADYFYRKTEAFLDHMDIHEKFVYFNNRGLYYYSRKDYPNSKKYHRQAFATVQGSPDYQYEQNLSKVNLAELYLIGGQPDSARLFLKEARDFFLSINQTSALSYIQTQEFALAVSEKDWDEAQAILQTMDDHEIEPSLMLIRKQYQEQYYTRTNRYKEAYQVLGERIRLDDSIRNEQIKMRVAEIDMRYKQDTTVMQQAIVIEKQQNHMRLLQMSSYLWISLCLLLILVLIFIYLYDKKQKAYITVQQKNKIAELKMENIRNRISPHFIFNVLNRSINYNELCFKKEEISELVKLLRQNLLLSEQLYISLKEELNFVRTYVHLESKRLDQFSFEIEQAPDVNDQQIFIPSMLIQIPVENAMKHGLRAKEGEKRLRIKIQREGNHTLIRIQDNGGGLRDQPIHNDNVGFGLKIITQTISLLNEHNKEKLELQIHNITTDEGETGVEVCFNIPDEYSYEL